MSSESQHNKPDRFADNEQVRSSEFQQEHHHAGSSFGEGYGTGLGRDESDKFGSGQQIEAGYGGAQYAGGSNYPAGSSPYGRPQQTGYNASSGSGNQYGAAASQNLPPASNIPKGKGKKLKKRK